MRVQDVHAAGCKRTRFGPARWAKQLDPTDQQPPVALGWIQTSRLAGAFTDTDSFMELRHWHARNSKIAKTTLGKNDCTGERGVAQIPGIYPPAFRQKAAR